MPSRRRAALSLLLVLALACGSEGRPPEPPPDPRPLDAIARRYVVLGLNRGHHPQGERFELEYVKGTPWNAYNWYKGEYRSLIQVNLDFPVPVDRAVDLACHEGYPGHHVYNTLLEQALVRQRGWVEVSMYPLFSPQSFIAEGTANFGIDMAFPPAERLALERDSLFPLAGLDTALAAPNAEVRATVLRLNYERVMAR